tara:strand:- start:814 stop:1059 length:246 start_codon:yes stop_codon:yes gene_type:complete
MGRNYKDEYRKYQGTAEQKLRRAGRNKARRNAIRNGTAARGDGKDVHHVDGNPRNNSARNTRVISASNNRSFARNKKAGKA